LTTISDVARMANVSVSTVSHVVNGTKRVSDATRLRVEEAIAACEFTPHQAARSLRSGRTGAVGLIVSDTSQYIFGRIIAEVEQGIRGAGHTLLLANSSEDREQEKAVVRALLANRVDGIIIAPVGNSDPKVFEWCDEAGIPVVLIDRTPDPGRDQVGIDNWTTTQRVTRHLIDIGHTNITIIAGDQEVWTIHERTLAFKETMKAAGLRVGPSAVLDTGRGLVDGREKIEQFLQRKNPPTAVIAASGLLALGALRAIRHLGLRIPGDLAFASFDMVMNAEFFEPKLTHVQYPVEVIGREATALIRRRMADPDAPPQTIQAPGALVHGTSCGCADGTPLTLNAADVAPRRL
jgi:LacI family transcriptional regulator